MSPEQASDNWVVGGPPGREATRKAWMCAALIAALFFFSGLPTLRWQQFSSGSENLVTATVLEMKRGGPLWTPTLKERPRLAKPPLTAWVACALVSSETIARLDSPDAAARDAAYRDLAFELRWPALLSTAIALLGAFEFGRLLLGNRVALVGMTMMGTSLLLTRFGRSATTDVQLMLWVTWTNALLLHVLLRGRHWLLTAAGITLAAAFMAKGPVAFAQYLAPATAVGWLWRREVKWRELLAPGVVASILFAALALPWYVDQLFKYGLAVAKKWKQEVTREGATGLAPDPFYNYLSLVPMMAPWFLFFLAGCVAVVRERKQPQGKGLLTAAIFVGTPIVIMSCVKDKPERYLLPMAAPASLLAAESLVMLYRAGSSKRDLAFRRIGMAMPWLAAAAVLVIGVSPLATRWSVIATGSNWFPAPTATLVGTALLGVLVANLALGRRLWWAAFAGAAISMVTAATLGLSVYTRSPSGQTGFRDAAELIRREYPGRPVYTIEKPQDPLPHDVNIYLNRVVPEVANMAEVTAPDAVLVLIQKERFGSAPIPPGWKTKHTLSAEKRVLEICVREPAAATAPSGDGAVLKEETGGREGISGRGPSGR